MSFFISISSVIVLLVVFWRLKMLKRKYLEPVFMGVFIFGIISFCQPFSFFLYTHAFAILMTGTFGYMAVSHFK